MKCVKSIALKINCIILAALICSTSVFQSAHAQTTSQNAKVIFILDGSGSMWGRVNGEVGGVEKIVVAKKMMTNLLTKLPDTIEMGLEVYGHRSSGDCSDIETMVPVGAANNRAMIEKLKSVNPKGKTPITQAILVAAEQLKAFKEEDTIVLISDGKETCGADPCAAVRSLKEKGIDIRVHVVGFDVDQDERDQLICIADAGNGNYFTANNSAQLANTFASIEQTLSQQRCATRNPFCVTDVPHPFDEPVKKFSETVPIQPAENDPNTSDWTASGYDVKQSSIGGYWLARWNGGGARSEWIAGTADIRKVQDVVYILYQDRTSTYLTEARLLQDNRLVGKYINVNYSSDSTPWVGNIVSEDRIDGYWGSGRWDYRR